MGVSREVGIAVVTSLLAVAAMAVDHLLGSDPGLEDPAAFGISSAAALASPPSVRPGRSARSPRRLPGRRGRRARARMCLAALVAVPLVLWLPLPFPLAGGAVALGLLGREGSRRRHALAAIGLGTAVLALAPTAYAVDAVRKLS